MLEIAASEVNGRVPVYSGIGGMSSPLLNLQNYLKSMGWMDLW